MRKLELLAPAKNLECGIAAIEHGADAVYIGAPRFGARSAAGNSVQDIEQLCLFAHRFGAKVYATVNTLLHDDEVSDAFLLMDDLKLVGVDAFLIQDARLLRSGFNIHASTQTDNRTPEKVAWLGKMGIKRVVLARELSLDEIRVIHGRVPDVELEAFVHGALCVSYSGACYASEYCFKRSANRGKCAQFCRMKFDLIDANGEELIHQRHLLSLKDMCRIDALEELAEAGIVSFKIEGRLKDVDYVKNVVSAYRRRLDKIIAKYPQKYERSSIGQVEYNFEPDVRKSFNRGFVSYFLHGRETEMASFFTPKSKGEFVGRVKDVNYPYSITVSGTATFANGDGLCFFNSSNELVGFRVNRVEGNRLFPHKMPKELTSKTELFRNEDTAFTRLLKGKTAVRSIPVKIIMGLTATGFRLKAQSKEFRQPVSFDFEAAHEKAEKAQHDNLVELLTKLGGTCLSCKEVLFEDDADKYFVPRKLLSSARRELVSMVEDAIQEMLKASPSESGMESNKDFESDTITQNKPKVEMEKPNTFLDSRPNDLLMQCRYCLRYELGYCPKHGGHKIRWCEPLSLRLADGRRFQLQFDCKQCQMYLYAK